MYSKEELEKRRARLSKDKRELILKQVRGELASAQAETSLIPKRPPSDVAPLSFAQQRLWFLQQLAPDSPAYNEPNGARLVGQLNLDALRKSFGEIVRRHEILRTVFIMTDGQPMQKIKSDVCRQLELIDLTGLSPGRQETELRQMTASEIARPFTLNEEAPLWGIKVFRLCEEDHVLLSTMHHIVCDGWSFGILFRELGQLYGAFCQGKPSPLPPLPIQYADFSVWQRDALQGAKLDSQLDYWQQQLAGLPPLSLPTDYPRPTVRGYRGKQHKLLVPAELKTELRQLAQARNASLFMTLLAAFKILLARHSGQHDFAAGIVTANRDHPETESLIGFFVNTLVIRTDLGGNPSFEAYLDQVRQVVLAGMAHQDISLEHLVAELRPERNLSQNPLFQVLFVFQNFPKAKIELRDLTIIPSELALTSAKFDLTLITEEQESGLEFIFEYDSDLFRADTIERLSRHFETLLRGIAAEPGRSIGELPLLTSAQQQQIVFERNETYMPYPEEMCLHYMFEEQADKTPESVAVVFEDQSLTCRQLNEQANQLAHILIAYGVGPDMPVGICAERSLEMVVAVYGVLKAGGAYVPLDPGYPAPRLRFMVQDARITVLLTQEHVFADIPLFDSQEESPDRPRIICLDRDWPQIETESTANPVQDVCADNLAYIIYTSGSTGRPKGVMISHKAIHNRVDWIQRDFSFSETDIFLQKTPFSFDASVWEFQAPLKIGAKLIMAKPMEYMDAAYLIELIIQHEVTILQVVPSLLQMLLEERDIGRCVSLRQVFCAGEALSSRLKELFFARLGRAELCNTYGPTEASIDTTFWKCRQTGEEKTEKTVPIGHPIANAGCHILDAHLNPSPEGVAGELHLMGKGLARGYFNRPDLTAERFVPNPFPKDEIGTQTDNRLYRAGDLARYLPDESIEFLGRTDNQVKIRGFRIELGETEAVLRQHLQVKDVVVTVREDTPGHKQLVAYMIPEPGQSPDPDSLRQAARQSLPDYMVPSAFVTLERFPLTPSGKTDRRAMPAPDADSLPRKSTVPPRTLLEKELAALWGEVLNTEHPGIHDNFFELGGHSLLAARLIARISVHIGRDLGVRVLFEQPTIADLAAALDSDWTASSGERPPLPEPAEPAAEPAEAVAEPAELVTEPAEPVAEPAEAKVETQPLLSLFAMGKIAPVDAAAITYISSPGLERTGMSRDELIGSFMNDLPLWEGILDTRLGRIATILLPCLDSELYLDQERMTDLTVQACVMAKHVGARAVSLAGILPAVTNHGLDVRKGMASGSQLPPVSTGHGTTTSAVVLTIKKMLTLTGRKLENEQVAFIGLGDVGLTSLRLMLRCLPHPGRILLYDLYSGKKELEAIRAKLISNFDFRDQTDIVPSQPTAPDSVYQASLIVGATNVGNVIDVARLRPGTLLIDKPTLHCFDVQTAIRRFETEKDILFSEGGILRSPEPISSLVHRPDSIRHPADYAGNPRNIGGCVLSGLLSACFETLEPTLGRTDEATAYEHYEKLKELGFEAADPHCGEYVLSPENIRIFRSRFGRN